VGAAGLRGVDIAGQEKEEGEGLGEGDANQEKVGVQGQEEKVVPAGRDNTGAVTVMLVSNVCKKL